MSFASMIATGIDVAVGSIAEDSAIVASGGSKITTVAVQAAILTHFGAALRDEAVAASRGELSNEQYFELIGLVVGAGVAIAAGVILAAPIAAGATEFATSIALELIKRGALTGLSADAQASLVIATGRGFSLALQYGLSLGIESAVENAVKALTHNIIDIIENAWQASKGDNTGPGHGYIDYARRICTIGYLSKDPLILDVSGHGLSVTSLEQNSPYYDISASGFASQTAWIGQGSGFLVSLDANGNVHLFTGDGSSGSTGFSQLAQMDVVGTGRLDASDPGFSTLYIWQDTNGDGKVDPGELQSLASLGISSLNLSYSDSSQDINGSQIVGIGSVTMSDGTTRELADVDLQASSVYTQADQTPSISAAIATLPELHGYGLMTDLQSQMAVDPTLVAMVSAFVGLASASTSFSDLQTATDAIMYQWAGVSDVDPSSRGGYLDARRLEFLEHYLGQQMSFPDGNYGDLSDPGSVPSLIDNQAFIELRNSLLARLLIQASPIIGAEFTYDAGADVVAPATDLWTSITDIVSEAGPLSSANLDVWSEVAVVLSAYSADYGVQDVDFAGVLSTLGVTGLDVLENAVSQGLAVSFDGAGTLHVSNAVFDGMLLNYGRFAGLDFVYNPGDGAVAIDFAEAANLEINQGRAGVPNTLFLGDSPGDFTVSIETNGDEVFTDGITGDALTVTGEVINDGEVQRGVQKVEFADGTIWTQAHLIDYGDQAELTSPFSGLDYDTRGVAHEIVASGYNNTFEFGYGYGQLTVVLGGGADALSMGAGISAADLTFRANDAGDLTVFLAGSPADTVTLQGDLFSWFGVRSNVQTVLFADGTSLDLTQPLTFTWAGDGVETSLTGSGWGANTFALGNGVTTINAGYGSLGGSNWNTFQGSANDGQTTVHLNGGVGELDLSAATAGDITLQSDDAGDLTVSFVGSPADSVTFDGDLYQWFGVRTHLQTIQFSDGTSLDLTRPLTFTWAGDGVETTLTGSGWGANTFDLGNGVTTVYAGYGSQTGSNWNTFRYAVGDGAVSVYLNGGTGELDLAGVNAGGLTLQSDDAGDLTVSLVGSPSDSVTLEGDLYGWFGVRSHVQTIYLADGTSLDLSQPLTFTEAGDGTETTLIGSGWGANTFALGNGVTTVYAGNGSQTGSNWNTFQFAVGDGRTSVHLNGGVGDLDLAGVNAGGVLLQADDAGDLTVSVLGSPSDSITFDGDLYSWFGVRSYVQSIRFADGTALDLTQPLTFTWAGDGTETSLTGSGWGANTFALGNGISTIYAGNGSNGGSMWNVVQFSAGDGQATVHLGGAYGELDLAGVNAGGVTLRADDAGDLTVSLAASPSDSVTFDGDLYNWFGVRSFVQAVRFADGTSLDLTQPLTFTWAGDGIETTLTGSGWGANTFELGNGVTTVIGGNGSLGGSAWNMIQFAAGDGHTTVNLNGGSGELDLSGVGAGGVTLQADDAGDLTVTLAASPSDTVTFEGDLYSYFGVRSHLQSVAFSDGTSMDLTQPLTFTWVGNATETALTGSAWGANTFNLGAGGDTVIGGNGSLGGSAQNTVNFSAGDGAATVNPNGGAVSVQFGAGISAADVSYSTDQSGDLLASVVGTSDSVIVLGVLGLSSDVNMSFGDGTQVTKAQLQFAASEVSQGSTITGTTGNDILDSQGTASSLIGGGGSDTYVYRGGEASVTISNGSSSNSGPEGQLAFGQGLNEDNLWLSQTGNDLVGNFLGSSNQFTVKDWFSGNPTFQLAALQTADGARLSGSGVSQLVTAMADYSSQNPAFAPNAATTMPSIAEVQGAIAAAWHH